MDVKEDDVEGSQDREAHFVRTCAVEMHMDLTQEAFFAQIVSRGKAECSSRGQHVCASLCNRNAHGHVTRG